MQNQTVIHNQKLYQVKCVKASTSVAQIMKCFSINDSVCNVYIDSNEGNDDDNDTDAVGGDGEVDDN